MRMIPKAATKRTQVGKLVATAVSVVPVVLTGVAAGAAELPGNKGEVAGRLSEVNVSADMV